MAVYINLKLVFRSLKGRCHDNEFLLVLSTQLGSGDVRQMALAVYQCMGVAAAQAASGAAGRANVGPCPDLLETFSSVINTQQDPNAGNSCVAHSSSVIPKKNKNNVAGSSPFTEPLLLCSAAKTARSKNCCLTITTLEHFKTFTGHFSGPDGAIGRMHVCVR